MQTIIESLGWALIHFTWQGLLIGFALAVALRVMQQSAASMRYAAAVAALLALVLCPIVTFLIVQQFAGGGHTLAPAESGIAAFAVTGLAASNSIWTLFVEEFRALLPVVVAFWLAGVVVFGSRLVRDWLHVRRLLNHGMQPLPVEWQIIVQRLSTSFGVKQTVRVFESTLVSVPMVIGWLKPVVLIPPSAILGLTPKQLELILAHEIAHVRRFDYLVNLIQLAIETLLFYHPVVRWVSTRIREERENCCDDMVVSQTGERMIYAQALTEMAELHSLTPQVTVAASGGELLNRIQRVISLPAPQQGSVHWLVGLVLVATGMTFLTTGQLQFDSDKNSAPELIETNVGDELVIVKDSLPIEDQPAVVISKAPETESELLAQPDIELQRESVAEMAGEPNATPVITPAAVRTNNAEVAKQSTATDVEDVIDALDRSNVAAAAEMPVIDVPEKDKPASESQISDAAQPVDESLPIASETVGGRLIGGSQPVFPRKARMRGMQGWVTIRYTVSTDGKVEDFVVLEAEPRRVFEKSVRRAARTWIFEPFLINGEPVAKTVEQTIEFALDPTQRSASRSSGCDFATGSRLCRKQQDSKQLGLSAIKQAALDEKGSQ